MINKRKTLLIAGLCCGLSLSIYSQKSNTIYKGNWIDFNKNGVKDIYEDPTADIDKRVKIYFPV